MLSFIFILFNTSSYCSNSIYLKIHHHCQFTSSSLLIHHISQIKTFFILFIKISSKDFNAFIAIHFLHNL